MESYNIERLLNKYFEGLTSLQEEKVLKEFFTGNSVPTHLEGYVPIFSVLVAAKNEISKKHFQVANPASKFKSWWYSVAAMLVIAVSVAGFMFSRPSISNEEQEALNAFKESRKAMLFLSENLNSGTKELAIVDQFTKTKNKILK